MTLAELKSTTMAARWRTLSAEDQEAIGAKVLEWLLAELVADDDGLDTSEADRHEARAISDAAFSGIDKLVEAAMPDVLWHYPAGTVYEARNAAGHLLGRVEWSSGTNYVFYPACPHRKRRVSPREAEPLDCLPPWARRAVIEGGAFRAVLPTV